MAGGRIDGSLGILRILGDFEKYWEILGIFLPPRRAAVLRIVRRFCLAVGALNGYFSQCFPILPNASQYFPILPNASQVYRASTHGRTGRTDRTAALTNIARRQLFYLQYFFAMLYYFDKVLEQRSI